MNTEGEKRKGNLLLYMFILCALDVRMCVVVMLERERERNNNKFILYILSNGRLAMVESRTKTYVEEESE